MSEILNVLLVIVGVTPETFFIEGNSWHDEVTADHAKKSNNNNTKKNTKQQQQQ